MDQIAIGKQIKELRIAKKMTQKELAEALHVTPQAVSNWERGSNAPDLDMLVSMSDLFGQKIGVLLLKEEQEKEVVKHHPWPIRYFLIPFLMLLPMYGILQAFLFLIVWWGALIFAAFGVVILSGGLQFIVMKSRGLFYVIVTLSLFFAMIVITTRFSLFLSISEIPSYTEVQSISSNANWENVQPLSVRMKDGSYDIGALIYPRNGNQAVLLDLSQPLEEMETTIQFIMPILSVVVVGDNFYIFTDGTLNHETDIYQLNRSTHESTLVLSSDLPLKGFEFSGKLICFDSNKETSVTTFYELDQQNLIEIQTMNLAIHAMISQDTMTGFASVIASDGWYQVAQWYYDPDQLYPFIISIELPLLLDEFEPFELARVDDHLFASCEEQLWRIGLSNPELTGLVGSVDDISSWDNDGYLFRGDHLGFHFDYLAYNIYYDRDYRPQSGNFMFAPSGVCRYVFEMGSLTEVRVYSQNVDEILLTPFWRTFWLFISIPFLTLPMSFAIGVKEKRKVDKNVE